MLVQKIKPQGAQNMSNHSHDVEPSILNNVHGLRTESCKPTVEARRSFRDALGRFATGVTLITANTGQGYIGMTVNSFASVSLDPALVLWSIAKKSGRYEAFRNASFYAIHILARSQLDLAVLFSKNANNFDERDWDMTSAQAPLAKRALARFECEKEAIHDGGDHSVFIGRVQRFSQRAGQPLIFTAGKFGTFLHDEIPHDETI